MNQEPHSPPGHIYDETIPGPQIGQPVEVYYPGIGDRGEISA